MACSCNKGSNLFPYKRKVAADNGDPSQASKETEFVTDYLNLNKVIRVITTDSRGLLVLMDDLHQRRETVEIKNKKGAVTGYKNETNTYQSEINITEKDDIDNFRKLNEIQ